MNNSIQLHNGDPVAQQNLALAGSHDGGGEDRIDLNSLLSILRRRRVLFLCVAMGIFALGMFLTLRATPSYSATATVVIDTRRANVAPANEQVVTNSDMGSVTVDTELEVLRSNEMANRVAEALKLDSNPLFAPPREAPTLSWWQRLLGRTPPPIPRRAYDTQAQRDYINGRLQSGLKVQRAGTTFALSITYSSPSPTFSADVANEYGRQYAQSSLLRKRANTEKAVAFLSKRIEELRTQANADTQAVQRYRIANNLLSNNALQLTEQELSTYNQQVANARSSAAEDQARLATAQRQLRSGSKGDDVGEALNSSVVSALKTQRAALAADLANLTTRYGNLHPDVVRTRTQLADLDRSIQTEINRVISNLKAKQNVSSAQLSSVQNSLGGARGTLQSSNKALVGFEDLTRKAAASQAQYEAYLARYSQVTAQEGVEEPDARIITRADTPGAPTSPNIPLSFFLSLVLGVGAGLGAAFITELSYRGLTTGQDIESRLGVPYLGSMPLLKSVMKWKGEPIDALVEHPHSVFAESFRNLQTSINYSMDAVVQVVVVTSALPREGKSTVATGLARSAALDGQRVLLIDCDLRRRSINKLVSEAPKAGLIDVLRGEASIKDAVVQDAASGAWLLPLNGKRIAPGDYFAGEQFRDLLNELRGEFTYIVLDTAPVLPIADTRVLATLGDAVVFVTRWRKTTDDAVRSALRLLPRGRVNLAGVMLSQVDARRQTKFGYGDSSYYYTEYKEYYS